MGILQEKIDSEAGGDIPQYYKDNTSKMYELYNNPVEGIKGINTSDIVNGTMLFLLYYDESNWMQYSPVLFIDHKSFDNKLIGYAINFNFIPLEIRSAMLDKIINNLEDKYQLSSITFEYAYKMLLKVGYEYALVEYDMKRVKKVFEIGFELLPNFLYSSYPANKYDPTKLYSIWYKKLETRELRHQEIIQTTMEDFFDITTELSKDFDALKGHIKRLQRNIRKFE